MLCDGGGLYLQVSPGDGDDSIRKSWVFRYAMPEKVISKNGRQRQRERQLGLGPLHTVTLAEARDKAMSCRKLLLEGTDPLLALRLNRGSECKASPWVSSGDRLAQLMSRIKCVGGATQIGRVLTHVRKETEKAQVQALVFIGDAMEENLKELAEAAGELGSRGVPIFMFHEPRVPPIGPCRTIADVRKAFRLLAMKSGGEYFEFNPERPQAIERLSEQLNAVARLAVGDTQTLEAMGGARTQLTDQRG
jgi:hypothetical protein